MYIVCSVIMCVQLEGTNCQLACYKLLVGKAPQLSKKESQLKKERTYNGPEPKSGVFLRNGKRF